MSTSAFTRLPFGLTLGLASLLSGCAASTTGTSRNSGPPTAVIQAPTSGSPGVQLTFVGNYSTDPQGQPLTFAWNFGDGTTSTYEAPFHTYAAAGKYTVTLTVTDTSNLSGSATQTETIVAPPVAVAGGPYSGYVNTPLSFNGTASYDPQGLPLTYYWSFGDSNSGTGVSPTHTYGGTSASNGHPSGYPVYLVVTNSAGVSSAASNTTATITIPPPTVTINGPYAGKPTLAINFNSTVVDGYSSSFTYLWSFGDGTTSSAADPTHTYAATGTYPISLTVTGNYAETATVTSTATITPQGLGDALNGIVKAGNTPIVGAHVYLFAANTTGYAQPSVSLLTSGPSDSIGTYAVSGADGTFALPAGYACPIHSQVYVYAAGGTVSSNTNSGTTLMTALGNCGALTSSTAITVNEATTIAAAYGLSGYATDALHLSSPNTTAAINGIANAFANAANLVSAATGAAYAKTPNGGNGTAPQATVNTLADVLNGCTSTPTGSNTCSSLFSATPAGTTLPTDTADAAINLAHAQGTNASGVYNGLQPTRPFTPVLTAQPHDFTLGITYGGLQGYGTQGLTLDAAGNVWVLQYPTPYGSAPFLTELSSTGNVMLAENTTCLDGNVATPQAIAADPAGNIWLLNYSGSTYIDINGDEQSYSTAQYCTLNNAGTMISPPGGYFLGGSETTAAPSLYSLAINGSGVGFIPTTTLLKRDVNDSNVNFGSYVVGNAPYVAAVAIDAAGNNWVSSPATNGIVKLSSTGALLSPANGYTGGGLSLPASVAIDHTGNVWAINSQYGYANSGFTVSELSPTGTALSPTTGYTNNQMPDPYSLAIDGAGNAWVATGYDISSAVANSVVELASNGSLVFSINHPNSGREYLNGPQSLAIDSTGSVWVSNGLQYNVTQFVGAATPVVTPVASNLAAPYNAPASRP